MAMQSAHFEYDVSRKEIRLTTIEDGEAHEYPIEISEFDDVEQAIEMMARVYKRMGFERVTAATINY